MHLIARDRRKEPIIPDDVDTPADDELSSSSSTSLSLSLAKKCPGKHKGQIVQEALASPYLQ